MKWLFTSKNWYGYGLLDGKNNSDVKISNFEICDLIYDVIDPKFAQNSPKTQ